MLDSERETERLSGEDIMHKVLMETGNGGLIVLGSYEYESEAWEAARAHSADSAAHGAGHRVSVVLFEHAFEGGHQVYVEEMTV